MRHLFVVALSVSMSALVALAIARGASTPQSNSEQALLPIEPEASDLLAARLSELERRLEARATGAPVEPLVSPRVELSGRADLEARLAQLEGAVAELLERRATEDPSGATMAGAMGLAFPPITESPEDPDSLAVKRDLNKVLMNPFASEAEKVAAHKSLRRVKDAYEPGAVQELLIMAQVSTDPDVRADVWTHFDGTTDVPEIVPDLVRAIQGETNDAVRIEAVETLGNYLEDPQNLTLLREIAKDDPVKAVRVRAIRTLKENPTLDD